MNHIGKAVTLWYNDQICRLHQPQQKAYKKREIKQTETESLNFNLTSIFEHSDLGSDNLGRIHALFEIGIRFWAHKNQCPNFDRPTKDIILILFNSH